MVLRRISPVQPSEVYKTYWRFAAERQAVFFRRLNKALPPWTDDPIIQEYKFTNAYRASDRVSQYLIRNIIYEGEQTPEEIFFRIALFKFFNRIETWELLMSALMDVSYAEYSFKKYEKILNKALEAGVPIYSAAYIMSSGKERFGYQRKHSNHLKVIEMMMDEDVPRRITDSPSMMKVYEILISYPTIGSFLGYQLATDINYSILTNFSEMDFVVPGPGAISGIRKCFQNNGGLNDTELIRLVADRQEVEFERVGVKFQSLWGRHLQLIDCQNLFCEVDKYARIAYPTIKGTSGRTRIKQKYRKPGEPITYWYPPKWKINHLIQRDE
jgi:hypothetical protein